MKNIKYIILGFIAISFLFSSCDDEDFLTEKPKTIYTPETAFMKSDQVDAQLVTAYRSAFDLYGGYAPFFFGRTNQTLLHGGGADFFDGGHIGINDGTGDAFSDFSKWNPENPKFESLWNSLYQLVSYANMALQGAEEVEWTNDDDKTYAVAQARFFRAWGYLRLAECFGGVPFITEIIENLKLDYARESRENIYRFVISELEAAAQDLPEYPLADGRVAQGVANHFLAEAYLALGVETNNSDGDCYTNAIAAASVTIGLHPLMTTRFGSRANPNDLSENNGVPAYKQEGNVFYDLFQVGNYDYSEGNTESVWVMEASTYDEIQATGISQYYSLTSNVGPCFRNMAWKPELQEEGVNVCPFAGNVDQTLFRGGPNSAYLGGMSMALTAETKYVSETVWSGVYGEDMRNDSINLQREFLCLNQNHSRYLTLVTPDDLLVPRMMFPVRSKIAMQDDWGWHPSEVSGFHQNQYGRDWYAVRSSETLLLRAEAYLRNGDADGAHDDIKTIRDRAQATYEIPAGEIDIYTILDERARELCYEEHRWPTLLRMGSSMSGTNEVMTHQVEGNAMYVSDVEYYTGGVFFTLFPIPQTVINLNTEAEFPQNEGWN